MAPRCPRRRRCTVKGSLARGIGHRVLVARRMAFVVASSALLACALAACGQTGGQTSTTGSAPQNCGTVTIHGPMPPTDAAAAQVESCFYQAYQRCSPATLSADDMGIDAGTDRTFAIQPGSQGGCTLTDVATTYVVPRGKNAPVTYRCTGLSQQSDGLHFSACGADGSLFIPAPAHG